MRITQGLPRPKSNRAQTTGKPNSIKAVTRTQTPSYVEEQKLLDHRLGPRIPKESSKWADHKRSGDARGVQEEPRGSQCWLHRAPAAPSRAGHSPNPLLPHHPARTEALSSPSSKHPLKKKSRQQSWVPEHNFKEKFILLSPSIS